MTGVSTGNRLWKCHYGTLSVGSEHGEPQYDGPYTVSRVNDNGTLQLRKDADNGGAVYQTWNIRNVDPCRD